MRSTSSSGLSSPPLPRRRFWMSAGMGDAVVLSPRLMMRSAPEATSWKKVLLTFFGATFTSAGRFLSCCLATASLTAERALEGGTLSLAAARAAVAARLRWAFSIGPLAGGSLGTLGTFGTLGAAGGLGGLGGL